MKKIHGIVATHEGMYVRAILGRTAAGWKLLHSDRWETHNKYKTLSLLNSGVHLGVESHWVRELPNEGKSYYHAKGAHCTACSPSLHVDLHIESLENNLLGVYPDDLFLHTLPMHFQKNTPASFIAVFKDVTCWKIGITIDGSFVNVFCFPLSDVTQLQTYLYRIEQYCSDSGFEGKVPHLVYCFGEMIHDPDEYFTFKQIELPSNDKAVIKAAGVAFSAIGSGIPAFSGPTEASGFRKHRSVAYVSSALLVTIVTLLITLLFILNKNSASKLSMYEAEYRNILVNNTEIRDLLSSGENLAKKLLRIQNVALNPTRWSQLLHLLGKDRPEKLYFDRIGSEPVSGQKNRIKIALTGWAETETVVTDLIKKLNGSDYITHVTLSTLERDEKQKEFCRFKIICTMILSKN